MDNYKGYRGMSEISKRRLHDNIVGSSKFADVEA